MASSWVLAGLVEFGDDGGNGVADAGDLRQPPFLDQAVQRLRTQREVFGGAGIGAGAVVIAAFQLHPLGQLPQGLRDGGGILFGHVRVTFFPGLSPTVQLFPGSRQAPPADPWPGT
jgi:hypothetical protein